MIVRFDKRKCNNCGLCVSAGPKVFGVDADGEVDVIDRTDKNWEDGIKGELACPTKAIAVILFK